MKKYIYSFLMSFLIFIIVVNIALAENDIISTSTNKNVTQEDIDGWMKISEAAQKRTKEIEAEIKARDDYFMAKIKNGEIDISSSSMNAQSENFEPSSGVSDISGKNNLGMNSQNYNSINEKVNQECSDIVYLQKILSKLVIVFVFIFLLIGFLFYRDFTRKRS